MYNVLNRQTRRPDINLVDDITRLVIVINTLSTSDKLFVGAVMFLGDMRLFVIALVSGPELVRYARI